MSVRAALRAKGRQLCYLDNLLQLIQIARWSHVLVYVLTYILLFFIILFIFARALDFSHMLVCCKQDGGNNKKKLNFLLFGVGLFVQ